MTIKDDRWVEWAEPYNSRRNGTETIYYRMRASEIVSARRKDESLYEKCTDEQVLDDFMVVHWAQFVTDYQESLKELARILVTGPQCRADAIVTALEATRGMQMTYDDETRCLNWESKARMMVALARADGVVITITQKPTTPLRMGGYTPVIEVRPAHKAAEPIVRDAPVTSGSSSAILELLEDFKNDQSKEKQP